MNMRIFWQGITIGFSISAPIGANGLLCISRSLLQGALTGFVSGLGAASAHLIYSCMAGLGLGFLTAQESSLKIIGGIFLCYLGIKIFFEKPPKNNVCVQKVSFKNAYLSGLFVALTNPQTIFYFLALFSSTGAIELVNSISTTTMAIGVFLGSAFWWLILSSTFSLLFRAITLKKMRYLNYLSGVIIIAFGLKPLFDLSH